MNIKGSIYILTNPSFPNYVKIGYADDVQKRLKQLNSTECTPFAFRLYAYYEVSSRLTDLKLHSIIDNLNPALRSREDIDGKKRVREFYAMSATDAYQLFQAIADINDLRSNLHLVEPTTKELQVEEEAEVIRTKRKNLPRLDWLIKQKVVNVGDEVYVIKSPDEIAIIVDGQNVNYKGEIMSLSKFCCLITGFFSVQSYAYTKLVRNNRTLSELREEKMNELNLNDNN